MFICCFVYIIGYADRYYDNSVTAITVKIVIDTRMDCL